ncbi:hypothetical protein [Tateyamaria sp. SN6-1]|uniref:hypothetical protein n=1 Tax=Tateyamaria sp. SN6-1 TaxID=3092148 RepID=UPI0039F59FF7
MSITEFSQTRGTLPTSPDAASVALEASTTNDRAASMIGASWSLAETYTGRLYWPVNAAVAVGVLDAEGAVTWPRYPFPAALTVEQWDGTAWAAYAAEYVPDTGEVLSLPVGRYRFTSGSVTPEEVQPHVVEAVRALALYQLVHSPTRREFKTITAADSTLTREALAGLFRASGAGILLAGEVRF